MGFVSRFATGNATGVIEDFMEGSHAPSSVTCIFTRGGLTDLLSTLGLGWEIAIPKMTLGQKSRLLLTRYDICMQTLIANSSLLTLASP